MSRAEQGRWVSFDKPVIGEPTPGPWVTGREDMQSFGGFSGEPFTNIYHDTITDGKHHATGEMLPLVIGRAVGENNKANARVMAAAPELLSVLSAARDALRSYQHGNASTELAEEIADLADHVLAKARGPR